jgi:hypothetical protein
MSLIPKSHPRAKSLFIREKLVSGFDNGLVAKEGLLAQGEKLLIICWAKKQENQQKQQSKPQQHKFCWLNYL